MFGCSKPDPAPHLKDGIYADIQKQVSSEKASLESEKKNLVFLTDTLEKAVPQSGQHHMAYTQYLQSVAKLRKHEQMLRYYEMRLKSREKDIKKRYMASFNSKEEFDTSAEHDEYSGYAKLKNAPRNWGQRVPKLRGSGPQEEVKQAKAAPPTEGS